MQRVAQDWLVLTIPGNGGAALGITTGLQFLPVLLLSPYAGVIADRFSKRRMLQATQLVMAAASLALGAIAAAGVAVASERLRRAPDVQHLAIMPDVHLARQVTVGTVMATQRGRSRCGWPVYS